MDFLRIDASRPGPTGRLRQYFGHISGDTLGGFGRVAKLWRGNRPAMTVLCVIDGRVIRADVDSQGALLGEPTRLPVECHAVADLATAIGDALKGAASPGSRLWVLYDGLPNYALSVPFAQVSGLSGELLDQALLFELEHLSGTPTANQQIAHALLNQADGLNLYWVNHVPRSLIGQLQRIASQHRCQLAGLLHPAGLPQAISEEAEGASWARLETWPDMLIGLHQQTPQATPKRWMMQASAKIHRMQGEVERWHNGLGGNVHLETLGRGVALDFLPENATTLGLDKDDTLRRWLGAWGEALAQGRPAMVPVMEPAEDPRRELMFMVGGGVAALLLCLAHAGTQYYRIHSHEADLVFLKGSQSRIFSIETEIKKYQGQLGQLKPKQETAKAGQAVATPEVLAALRTRSDNLLRELATNVSDGVVIEEIHTKPDAVVIKGASLDVNEINALAVALAARLRGFGWQAKPAQKKDLALDAAGGPWEFEILLADVGLAGFAAAIPAPTREAAHEP